MEGTFPGDMFGPPDSGATGTKGGPTERRPIAAVTFDGRAHIDKERENWEGLLALIPELNGLHVEICDEIRSDIKKALPPDLDCVVGISFSAGSVAFSGWANFFQTLNDVNNVITAGKYLADLVRSVIEGVVLRQVGRHCKVTKLTTRVREHQVQVDSVPAVTRVLWWCSGASIDILRSLPTETAKFFGLGGAVLATGLLAMLSGGLACYQMFADDTAGLPLSLMVGLLWGAGIFNLDRTILATLKKSSEPSGPAALFQILQVGPLLRLVFALFIGFVVSVPLELHLFHREISNQMEIQRKKTVDTQAVADAAHLKAAVDTFIQNHESLQDLATKQVARDKIQQEAFEEIDGTDGTHRPGAGRYYAEKKERLVRADSELDRARERAKKDQEDLDKLTRDIQSADSARSATLSSGLGDGFLSQYRALKELASAPHIQTIVWAITALLVLIEVIPILVKVYAPYGPYDAKLNLRNEWEILVAELKKGSDAAIARCHFDWQTKTELALEEIYHQDGLPARSGAIRAAWWKWRAANSDGDGPSVDAFWEYVRKQFFMNRTP
jgi:hypothetical protein